jgi:hypothetical protein
VQLFSILATFNTRNFISPTKNKQRGNTFDFQLNRSLSIGNGIDDLDTMSLPFQFL